MKSPRKAQGLSINTIIIAALGLAVLVILFAVFTGRIGKWTTDLDKAGNINCNSVCTGSGYSIYEDQGETSKTCTGQVLSFNKESSDGTSKANYCCCRKT